MTALTPRQMRELADTQERAADIDRNAVRASLLHDSAATLRTAADQLEAVRAFTNELRGAYGMEFVHGRLSAILTADTTGQESRDE